MPIASVQTRYRFRTDTLTVDSASVVWGAAENTTYLPTPIQLGTPFRLRFEVQNTGSTSTGTATWEIYYSRNAGAYVAVTSSSTHVQSSTAANTIDADDTSLATRRLTSDTGTYTNGRYDSTGQVASGLVTMASGTVTEFEFGLVLTNACRTGDTIDLQMRRNGATTTFSFTVTPRITVSQASLAGGLAAGGSDIAETAPPSIVQKHVFVGGLATGASSMGQPQYLRTLPVTGIASGAASLGTPTLSVANVIATLGASTISYGAYTADGITVTVGVGITAADLASAAASLGTPTLSVAGAGVTLVAVSINSTTNLIQPQINQFPNPLSNCSVLRNNAQDITNAYKAERLIEDTAFAYHYAQQSVGLTSGQTYTYWAELHEAERTWAWFALGGTSIASGYFIDIHNKAFGSAFTGSSNAGEVSKSIVDLGGGWIRVQIAVTASVTEFDFFQIGNATGDTVAAYVGDGTSSILVGRVGIVQGTTIDLAQINYPSLGRPIFNAPAKAPLKAVAIGGTNTILSQIEFSSMLSASIAANVATDPTGATNADKLQEDSSTGQHYAVFPNLPSVRVGSNIFWIELKVVERTWAWTLISGTKINLGYYIDIANKKLGSLINSDTYITDVRLVDLGSGWVRFEVVINSPVAESAVGYLGPAIGDNANAYTGTSGNGFLVGRVGFAPGDVVDFTARSAASLGAPTIGAGGAVIAGAPLATRSAGLGLGNNLVPAFPS